MESQSKSIRKVIIVHSYSPGSAATNRVIAYAKGFVSLGVETHLVLGNESHAKGPEIGGVNICLVEVVRHADLIKNLAAAVKTIYESKDSVVIVYGSPLLCWFLPKSKYNIFYECTEVPYYGRKKTLVSRLKEGIKTFLSKSATGMFVISQALKQYFEAKGISNIAVINMFVDSARFVDNNRLGQGEKYIGYCGTISPLKDGVDILLKSFAIFHTSHPDYHLKLIGRFESDDSEKYLIELVDVLQIADSVRFTGLISPAEMPSLLCGAQMLVLARPDNEQAKYGFPTKLGEYLATGKPVVITDVGEIGSFMKDFYNCRLAKPGDVNDFAEKMCWVADHYEEAMLLGLKGKLLTETDFSSESQCKKALSFMEDYVQ